MTIQEIIAQVPAEHQELFHRYITGEDTPEEFEELVANDPRLNWLADKAAEAIVEALGEKGEVT